MLTGRTARSHRRGRRPTYVAAAHRRLLRSRSRTARARSGDRRPRATTRLPSRERRRRGAHQWSARRPGCAGSAAV